MYEDFRAELSALLNKSGAPTDVVTELLTGYDAEFEKLLSLGKSEFEIIVSFGDPADIVRELKNPDDLKSTEDELLENPLISPADTKKNSANKSKTVILLVLLWSLATVGFVFLLGLAGFILYAGVPYLWKSFSDFETVGMQVGAFTVCIMSLLMSAFIVFCTVKTTVIAIKFTKKSLNSLKA